MVCAGGSQVWTGHSGTLIPSPTTRRVATRTWVGVEQPGAVGRGEPAEVGRPALDDEDEDAEEHQRRPEGGEEDEPVRRVGAGLLGGVVVAEPADEHPHRDEDDLEGDEEQDRVAGEEGGQGAELDEQQARVVGRGGVRGAGPGPTPRSRRDRPGSRPRACTTTATPRAAVSSARGMVIPSTAKCQRSPSEVTHGASTSVPQDDGQDGEQEGHDAGDEGEPAGGARRIPAAGGEQPDGDDGGDDEGQRQCHTVTPATATRTTPTTTATRPADGAARWARSPSRPAMPVRDAAPRG